MTFRHTTVLLHEAIALLRPEVGKVMVDATLGGGGHSEALLAAGATVIGLDRDPRALEAAQTRLAGFPAFKAVRGNFAEMVSLLEREGHPQVDGVLADLGVSSAQLDVPERGFSFQTDGPLDMRMGDDGPTAAERIADGDEAEIARVLYELGDEKFSRPIARELKRALPQTTFEAVEAVKRAVPRKAWPNKINVATRTFQALRIWVNGELEALEALISALPKILRLHGRAAIISFHSLEDRFVKQSFRNYQGQCVCPPGLPVCVCGAQGDFKVLTPKAIAASDEEIAANPRSRSAHLRAVEKIR